MPRKQTGDAAARARAARYDDAVVDPAAVLSRRQLVAVELIAGGKSDAEVAEAIGVDALTVLRWRTKHPAVKVLVNRAGADQLDRVRRKVRALVPLALDRIEKALDDPEDGLKAALVLVKIAGLERRDVTTVGPGVIAEVVSEDWWAQIPDPLFDSPRRPRLQPETAAGVYAMLTDGLDDDGAELPDKVAHNGQSPP